MPEGRTEIERLREELTSTNTKLKAVEQARNELVTRVGTLSSKLEEAQATKIRAEAVAEEKSRRINEQASELNELRAAISKAREDLRKQEGEIGRLHALSETVESLRAERERSLGELAQVKADVEHRIAEEVKASLERASKEYEQATAQWAKEKEGYLTEIVKLKEGLERSGVAGYVFPTDLASRLAKVLDELAEGKPAPGRQFAAALTALEVEARGVLESPRKGEEEPRFVTVEAGKIDPATLSTLRMTFKILPRLASSEG